MESILTLTSILGVLLVGVVSPGPSFLLVSRTSIATSRSDGLAAALGMGVGGAVLGTLALLGLAALLTQVGWLHAGLKLLGGAYLLYLGILIWRGASKPLAVPVPGVAGPTTLLRSLGLALMTQVSNPKAVIFYGSIFVAMLPASPPAWMLIVLPALIFLLETSWYALVALVFSANRPRLIYLGLKAWIDRGAGVVMGALGVRMIYATARP